MSPILKPSLSTERVPAFERRADRLLGRWNLSIRTKILLSLLAVIVVMGSANAIFIVRGLQYKRQYDEIITNITTANSLNGFIKPTIDTMMWDIVAGKTAFEQGDQYVVLDDVRTTLTTMMEETDSEKGAIKLAVILRTLDTLTHYVDLMGEQTARNARVAENEAVLENIRGVSELVEDLVQEYMLFEVNRSEQKYWETQRDVTRWVIISLISTVLALVFSVIAAWLISRSIYLPIKRLHDLTTTIAERDLEGLVTGGNADEITEMGRSFNIMVGKVQELLDFKLQEQENLRKYEFRILQAQINPHFLYNTLDTIIWKAEGNQKEQVVQLVRALSTFFRVSLSRGEEWISVRDEIDHVKSYLAIQSMRYRDILDYEIDVDEALLDEKMLKFVLQPLVENALYHGIKNKRGGGTISVRGQALEDGTILFDIEDDGAGIESERLAMLRRELKKVSDIRPVSEAGFGIRNVNSRLKLYYGPAYGLSLVSSHTSGTCMSARLPRRVQEKMVHAAVAPLEIKHFA
jgi:two-component system sensor histidine kinase YesM